jgi:hypothetical protein
MNNFLQDFIRRQGTIIQSSAPQQEPVQRDRKGRKKSKYGTADGRHPFGEEDAFARLCSEKPSKKRALEYFRNRIAELVAAEEF